jgi:hypothetical protein
VWAITAWSLREGWLGGNKVQKQVLDDALVSNLNEIDISLCSVCSTLNFSFVKLFTASDSCIDQTNLLTYLITQAKALKELPQSWLVLHCCLLACK